MTAENAAGLLGHPEDEELPLSVLARRQGVLPVQSVHDMARPDLFDSDEEVEEFLAEVYAARRADLGSDADASHSK